MNKDVLKFQKDCYQNYLKDLCKQVPSFPDPYTYPDGNPIRPVVPTQTVQNSIMLIGAFPSARFERRDGKLIPVGDNLSPFGHEEYFDGREVRSQASRDSLDSEYFPQLGIDPRKIWITDIVKVYLYPDKHIKNCKELFPGKEFTNTHCLFESLAKASMNWMQKEIDLCDPRLIITLGEIPAKVISGFKLKDNSELLNGQIREVTFGKTYPIAHLGHPEIRRINSDWDKKTRSAIQKIAVSIRDLNLY